MANYKFGVVALEVAPTMNGKKVDGYKLALVFYPMAVPGQHMAAIILDQAPTKKKLLNKLRLRKVRIKNAPWEQKQALLTLVKAMFGG